MSQFFARAFLGILAIGALPVLGETAYIAIIIDDIGHSYSRGVKAVELPAPLTYSILPYTTHASELARLAHSSGKEIMLHLPMENIADGPIGPGGLTSHLSRIDFESTFLQAVANVPFAIGINNHMGSALTQQPQAMHWLMEEIKAVGFFFIDSRTTPLTVASTIARENNLPSASRDVFLDNEITEDAIDFQFHRLKEIARKNGTAIAIGHPHLSTLNYLSAAIPLLDSEGIKVISVSDVLALRHIRKIRQFRNMQLAGHAGQDAGR